MSGKKLQLKALLGLVVVIIILVGVLVWPAPKEARADNTAFTAYIVWIDFEPLDPENVVLWVNTYDNQWLVVEHFELVCVSTINGESKYQCSIVQALDPNGIHWGVEVIDDAGYNIEPGILFSPSGTNFSGTNALVDDFEGEQ